MNPVDEYKDCLSCTKNRSCLGPISDCEKRYNIAHYHLEALCAITEFISLDRLREMCEGERSGRCVVLSTPMIPLMISDDEMDSDVYCPACGRSVSGGWDDYHIDQGWKLCQCPYCGQSIDDTKVITRAEAEAALKEAEHE